MHKRLLLLLFGLVFIFQPNQVTAQSNLNDLNFNSEELSDLFRLSHQLLYYHEDLKDFGRQMDDVSRDYLTKIDSLQQLSESILDTEWLDKGFFGSFRNEIDPVLKTTLNNLHNVEYFSVIKDSIFINIQSEKDEFLDLLETGEVRFARYLPKYLKEEIEADIEVLNSNLEKKVLGGAYNTYLILLKELGPKYEQLLSETNMSLDMLIEAYIEVKAEEYKIELIYYFLRKYNQGNFDRYFESINLDDLYTQLNEYMEVESLARELIVDAQRTEQEIQNYLNRKNKEFYDLRVEIVEQIDEMTKKMVEATAREGVNSLVEYVTENPVVKEYQEEATKYIRGGELEHDFIDIKNNPDDKFWVRIKFTSGSLRKIQQANGDERILEGSFFLVYHPSIQDDVTEFHGSKLFLAGENDRQEIQESISNLYVEASLGLTITNLKLSTRGDSNDYRTILNSGIGDSENVYLSYATQGIWNNFNYNYQDLENFAREFQLPEALGITLHKIEVDQNTWQPTLFFLWKPKGFFAELLPEISEKEFTVSTDGLNLDDEDLKHALEKKVKEEIERKTFALLNDRKSELEDLFFAEEIQIDPLEFKQETLEGQIHILPNGFKELFGEVVTEEQSYVSIKYRFYIREGIPQFHISKPSFPASQILINRIKSEIELLSELFDDINSEGKLNFTRNLTEEIEVKDLLFDFDTRKVCSQVVFHAMDKAKLEVCFDGNAGRFNLDNIDRFIKVEVYEFAKDQIAELIKDQFIQSAFGPTAVCNSIPNIPKLYGLEFEKVSETDDCRINIRLPGGATTATLQYNGTEFRILAFNPEEDFKNILLTHIDTLIFQNESVIQLGHTKFNEGIFSVALYANITKSPDFAFLGIEPIYLGNIELNKEGFLRFNNRPSGALDLIKDYVLEQIDIVVEDLLKEALPRKIDFEGIALIRIIDIQSDLKSDSIRILGEIDFESIEGLTLAPVTLALNTKTLDVKPTFPENDEIIAILENGIIANFMTDFLGVCDNGVGICDLNFDRDELALTGVIRINITDMLMFPGIEFTLTPKKFDYVLKPEFVLYGTYPIAPPAPVVIIDPTLEFDFTKELIRASTVITMGATDADARSTANIAKIDTELTIALNNLDRADYSGVFKLINVLPVYYGDGYLDIGNSSFGMSQGTTGVLDEIIHFNRKLDFYGDYPGKPKQSFVGSGELSFLGMDARLSVDGRIKSDRVDVGGSGSVRIPLVELSGEMGTTYKPYIPLSYLIYGRGSLSGRFDIGEFELSGFNASINIHKASAIFEVLEARFGITVPLADALTEDVILDMILDMFEFDIIDLEEFLENLSKISLSDVSVGFGDGGDAKGGAKRFEEGVASRTGSGSGSNGNGQGDSEGDQGTGGIEEKGDLVRMLNLSLKAVNDSRTNTVSEYQGRKCKKIKLLFDFSWDCKDVYKDKQITIESFQHSNWPGWYSCLPAGYQNYYAVFDPKEKHSQTKNKVYDLIHKSVGDQIESQKIQPFFIRAELEPDLNPRNIGNQNNLCLSREVGGVNPNEYCVAIPEISDTVYSEVDLYGSLGFGQDEKVYVFTSARLPEMSNAFCRASTSTKTYSVPNFKDEMNINNSFMDIVCHNCIDTKSNSESAQNRIRLERLQGFEVLDEVSKRDPFSSFAELPGTDIPLLEFMIKMVEKQDTVMADDSVVQNISDNENSDSDEIDIDEFKDELYNRTKNLNEGDLILFDKCSDAETTSTGSDSLASYKECRLIIVNGEESSVSVSIDVVKQGLQNELNAFYELTGEVFKEIDLTSFKNLFKGYLDNLADYDVSKLFKALTDNNNKLYYEMQPILDEYIQNWVYYGRAANTIDVQTTSPEYEFTIWDNSNLVGNKNYTYTFAKFTKEENPLNLDTTYYYKFPVSDLTNLIGLTDLGLPFASHKSIIENNYNNHVYRNLLFFQAKDTLNSRILLFANSEEVIYGLNKTESGGNQSLKLIFVEKGNGVGLDIRESSQLFNMNYRIGGSRFDIDIEIDAHPQFFKTIFERLRADSTTRAYIQQFPGEEVLYRAILFTGNKAEMIWEKDPQTVYEGVINNDFITRWNNMQNVDEVISRRRITLGGEVEQSSKAELILTWFEGFDDWFNSDIVVNPISLFNLNN